MSLDAFRIEQYSDSNGKIDRDKLLEVTDTYTIAFRGAWEEDKKDYPRAEFAYEQLKRLNDTYRRSSEERTYKGYNIGPLA